jgi:hypothetical protein
MDTTKQHIVTQVMCTGCSTAILKSDTVWVMGDDGYLYAHCKPCADKEIPLKMCEVCEENPPRSLESKRCESCNEQYKGEK